MSPDEAAASCGSREANTTPEVAPPRRDVVMLDALKPLAPAAPAPPAPPACARGDHRITSHWTVSACTARYEELLRLLFDPVSAVDDRMRG